MRYSRNNETAWDRFINQTINDIKITFPISVGVFFLLFLSLNISLLEDVLIALVAAMWIYTLFDMFYQTPNYRIPNSYPPILKIILYIVNFIFTSFLLYMVSVGILQHHYAFFENLICCDMIKNFDIRETL